MMGWCLKRGDCQIFIKAGEVRVMVFVRVMLMVFWVLFVMVKRAFCPSRSGSWKMRFARPTMSPPIQG